MEKKKYVKIACAAVVVLAAVLCLTGIFSGVPKTTGTALTAGQVVFWQTSTSKIIAAAATGAFACGYATKAAASADDECEILLCNGANLKKTS